MAKLPLDRCHVAGLLDDVAAHRVPCAVGRPALDAGGFADIVPHIVDNLGRETTISVTFRAERIG